MKALTFIALSISLFSTYISAAEKDINPDTARAYKGYMLTFLWPENQSSEHIDYQNVLSLAGLQRLSNTDLTIDNNDVLAQSKPSPFDNIKKRLSSHVSILANKEWTLIFRKGGDVITKNFHSNQIKDGYPELTGNIRIKLGRYLESDIRYQHFLFDSFTQRPTLENHSNLPLSAAFSNGTETKAFEPALVLKLDFKNKTASKKVNYLDHPKIGTMIYFEPMELEDAMAELAAQSITPETGKSLNYDSLRSTNELSSLVQ